MGPSPSVEPADLVRRAAAGDSEAWSGLVDRFGRLVFAVCRGFRLTEADAADVTQTVWLRLAENLDRLDRPERVGAWLVTTAKRECLALARARARFEPWEPEDAPSGGITPEAAAERSEISAAVAVAFAQLSDRCRDLLRRVVVGEESYRRISEDLGMPVGAIGPTRARCLGRLREALTLGAEA